MLLGVVKLVEKTEKLLVELEKRKAIVLHPNSREKFSQKNFIDTVNAYNEIYPHLISSLGKPAYKIYSQLETRLDEVNRVMVERPHIIKERSRL